MNFGVFFGPERIGTLESAAGRLRFQYAPDYVGRVDRTVSVRLPPRAEPYADDETRVYFANLLPEDEYRRLLARELGVADRNVAGLLAAIGECAGAVSVWPEGKAPYADAHAKNLALVHEGGFVTIAPFYDVVCTHLYSGLKRHMAMSVGGEYRLGYVRERHWHRFASDLGVGPAAVRDTALALATRLEAVLPDVRLSTTARFGASPVVSKVERVFRRQVAALRAALE